MVLFEKKNNCWGLKLAVFENYWRTPGVNWRYFKYLCQKLKQTFVIVS